MAWKKQFMRIGIDISQIAFEGTGVGNYVRRMVAELLKNDKKNEYVLFGASLRRRHIFFQYFRSSARTRLVILPIPPTLLEFLWNRLHIIPVEWFTGPIDVFWSSDWTQPPLAHARGVTTVHDLIVLRHPKSFGAGLRNIVQVQKRRLKHALVECQAFFVDSQATKTDAMELLSIPPHKLTVIYPGFL